VSEPWHSLIDPDSLESPITHGTKQEMINHHPILKNMMARYVDENSYPSEINYPELTKQDISRIQAVYLGMCAEVDSNIGKILQALDDSGQADNTMIIFTSDHGEMLGDYWQWGKNGWWDQSYRIPLIVHTPNCKAQLIDQMTESVDLAPTIIDWLGGDIPADWNGRSLLSIVGNTQFQLPAREFVVFEWDFRELYYTDSVEKLKLAPEECNLTVIRSNEWKYVHFPTFPSLLYNLNNDPYEKDNLASNPTYDSIKAEMAGKLLSHRMLHAERQLSNTKLTSTGPQTFHGPPHRRILEN
jgi:arylsulfatase A-like enzyme